MAKTPNKFYYALKSREHILMSKSVFENPKLSFAAMGLMGFLTCAPPDIFSIYLLEQAFGETEDIPKLLDELIEAGFCKEYIKK